MWALPIASFPAGPGDVLEVAAAVPLTDDSLYAGHLLRDRAGDPVLVALRNESESGFVGAISDPLPVHWSAAGVLSLVPASAPR